MEKPSLRGRDEGNSDSRGRWSSRLLVPRERQPTTSSAIIRQDLRADIIAQRLLPGVPLAEKEIAARYGVSRTPVREAILRLADEGLIEIFPQSGTYVSRIPVRGLTEAIIIRKSLEETTTRMAATRASRYHIASLRSIMDRLREARDAGDRELFHQADDAFHGGIAEAAGHPGIWALVQQVKLQVDRYRRLTLPEAGRLDRVIREHEVILNSIADGDPTKASQDMDAHLGALLTDIENIKNLNPEYFSFPAEV